jgi:hypothetical protein
MCSIMSTFFMFWLYAAPAARMSALMKLRFIGIGKSQSTRSSSDLVCLILLRPRPQPLTTRLESERTVSLGRNIFLEVERALIPL